MKDTTKHSILFLLVYIFISCVPFETKREFIENNFISNNPALKVKFKKEVINFKEQGRYYLFSFDGKDVVAINFERSNILVNKLDYFYSLEFWIKSMQRTVYIGPSYFNDHQWAKYARVNKNYYLHTGYLTRKDYDTINIYNYVKMNDDAISAFKEYQRTLIIKDSDKKAIDQRFEKLNELLEIMY